MDKLYARAVFFVKDTERSIEHYTKQLGFTMDWGHKEEGRIYVGQVSLHGFEVILNQVWGDTTDRAGHGRVFIGLEDHQLATLRAHIARHEIPTERREWGQPTLVIRDLDGNEMFFWDWPDKP